MNARSRAPNLGGTPIWTDRGESEEITYRYNGADVPFPKRWTEAWVRSLSEDEFLAASRALSAEGDYWSAFNLRTLAARESLFYRERIRRYG